MFSSKKTKDINLLSESEGQSDLSKLPLVLIFFLLIISAAVVLGSFLLILNNQESSKSTNLEVQVGAKNLEWQKVASGAASISLIKNKISLYQSFAAKYPPIEDYIANISKYLPGNISLVSLDIDNSGVTSLQAKAPSAAAAYQLTKVFEKETGKFSAVKIVGLTRSSSKEEYIISLNLGVAK